MNSLCIKTGPISINGDIPELTAFTTLKSFNSVCSTKKFKMIFFDIFDATLGNMFERRQPFECGVGTRVSRVYPKRVKA